MTFSPTIEVKHLHKSYFYAGREVSVLSGIDLTLPEKKHLVVLGPSGCGKSTFLNLLSLLDRPDRGEISLLGQNYAFASDSARRRFREKFVGFIFQSFHLIGEMNVFQNVILPGQLQKTPQAEKRARELLDQVELQAVARHSPLVLSGGERQRVAIARALFHHPRFLFADEPTGNLDSQTGCEVMNLIRDTCHESGAQMVLVTHNESLVGSDDQVVTFDKGCLLPKQLA